MINTLSHITNSAHKENSSIIHWLISNPAALAGLIIFLVTAAFLLVGHYKDKNQA